MITRTLLITLSIFLAASCNSKKTATETTTNSIKTTMTQEEMIANGFVTGTIEESTKEGDCPFTIKMTGEDGNAYFYDPINLDDSFKKDGMDVIFKFRGLRRMNRCEKANPVEIEEIQGA